MSKFALLFIMIFAYGIYSAIATGPVWGFYLYELTYFLNPKNRWWGGDLPQVSYSFIVVLVMIGSFFLRKDQRSNTLKEMPEAKWFVAILLSYGLATILAANPEVHNRFMIYLINTYITMYFAYRMIESEKKLELALLFYLVGAAYIGYEAMVVGRDIFGRVEGIGTVDSPEANTIAASIAPVVTLIIYFIWHGSVKVRIISSICGLLVINGLVLINSRGAFLGAVIGLGYYIGVMIFSRYKLPRQRLMVIAIVISVLVVSARLIDDTFIERMATLETQSSVESEGSGGRRINFWFATFDLLEDHPFGVGIYGYETLSSIYLPESLLGFEALGSGGGKVVRAVHSIWFQSLSEIGWVGFAAFIMLLISIARHLRKAKLFLISQSRFRQYYLVVAVEGSLITFFIASSFINMFRSQILYWMLLFSICVSLIMLKAGAQKDGESRSDAAAS